MVWRYGCVVWCGVIVWCDGVTCWRGVAVWCGMVVWGDSGLGKRGSPAMSHTPGT